MEFGLSDEQKMLQESVKRFVEAQVPLDRVREIAETRTGFDTQIWNGLVELGVTAVLVPEEQGGAGLGGFEAALVQECLGWGVVPAPFAATAMMAPVAIREAASPEQQSDWLARIATGDVRIGVGLAEVVGAREGAELKLQSGKLSGKALFVLDAQSADHLLLAVGANTLALVDARANGVEITPLNGIDRTRVFAEVQLDGSACELLGGEGNAAGAIQKALDMGRVALAADNLGAAQHMIEKTVAYSLERQQFKRVIGSFQGYKHMCAEMAADVEPARSLVWYAAHCQSAIPADASVMACHAKAHLAEVCTEVANKATLGHGGMGFTDLLGLHYWFKRIGYNRQVLGGPEAVRAQAAALQGLAA
ncbi:MAG: acyl-CoA dehydrogenase family protein [Pseudomonadota bacterium]|nr:acyl-CoA dehydrogenase family protein [Pseudomonadota bacterium]